MSGRRRCTWPCVCIIASLANADRVPPPLARPRSRCSPSSIRPFFFARAIAPAREPDGGVYSVSASTSCASGCGWNSSSSWCRFLRCDDVGLRGAVVADAPECCRR
ncbi:hypothetical protein C8R47DRAFT_1154329 [Mycena vitilis]|nr:hypothetical protein C8R47DRAFT_1154329 [Mycena vitilis]